jgi:fibronectin-binding autotransporter adhesin
MLAVVMGCERAAFACVTPGGGISFSGTAGCIAYSANASGNVVNNGTLNPTGPTAPTQTGISVGNASTLTGSITNNGNIVGVGPAPTQIVGIGINGGSLITGDITNAGAIIVAGTGAATGISVFNSTVAGSVSNSGRIVATAGTLTGIGIGIVNASIGGGVTNSGTISVVSNSAAAIGIAVLSGTVGSNIVNSGTITPVSSAISEAVGILVGRSSSALGGFGTTIAGGVTNSGLISTAGLGGGLPAAAAGIIVDEATVAGDVVNSGTIIAAGLAVADGINVEESAIGGGITNSGTIRVSTSSQAIGIGVLFATVAGNVVNSWTISVSSNVPLSPVTGISVDVAAIGGSVSNSGTISVSGGFEAIGIGVFIASVGGNVVNSGSLILNAPSGAGVGIGIFGGTLNGSLVNSGTIAISALAGVGLAIEGSTISSGVTNTGTINAGVAGIGEGIDVVVSTVAGGITNAGQLKINAGSTGFGILVTAATVIGDIVNSGTISVAGSSQQNAGILITNTSTNRAALKAGSGGSGSIINSGTIIAMTGIALAGGATIDGSINNSGTIVGTRAAIDLATLEGCSCTGVFGEGKATVINQDGGRIIGDIVGNSAVNTTNAGTVNFNLGNSYPNAFTTGGTIDVNQININSGTLVLANDVTVFSALTNSGNLQVNIAGGMRTINGNYIQNSTGTLTVEVSPTSNAQLNVTGKASLSGTLTIAYDPGIYTIRNYTLLQAGSISGVFSSVTNNPLTHAVTISATTVVLTTNVAGSASSGLIAQAVGPALIDGNILLSGLGDTINIGPNPQQGAPLIIAPTNDTVFSAMATIITMNAQLANGVVLDRIDSELGGTGSTSVTGELVAPTTMQLTQLSGGNGNLAAVAQADAVLPQLAAQFGGWFRGIGSFASLNGNSVAPGLSADSGGFLSGFDREVWPGIYAGVAGGYAHSDVNEHSTSSGTIDNGRIMLYGGGLVGSAVWSATAGYAHDSINTSRGIIGLGTATESHGANEVTAGVQLAQPFHYYGVTLTPKAGVQFVRVYQGGFAETGALGFNLSASGQPTDSIQPFIGLSAAETFITEGGWMITPELRLGYAREVSNDLGLFTVATFSQVEFLVDGIRPSRNMLTGGLGLSVKAQDDLSFYANYDTLARTGNAVDQTVSVGLRVKF